MKKIKVIQLLLLLSCCGCVFKNDNFHLYQQDNIIDSSEIVDLSDAVNHICTSFDTLVTEIRIIPLETKDASVVSDIDQVITTSDFIYILDHYKNGSVIIFGNDGSFIKRLPLGGAPHEIGRAERIFYDQNDSILFVYDEGNNKMIKFTSQGDYINHDAVNTLFVDFAVLKDSYVLVQPSFQSSTQMFSVCIIDSTDVNYWVLGADYPDALLLPYIIDGGDDGILITKPKSDFIYYFDGRKVFKKYKVITNAQIDYSESDAPEKVKYDLSSGLFYFKDTFIETNNYQIVSVVHGLGICTFVVRNKRNGNVWFENLNNTVYCALYSSIGVHNYNINCLNGVISPEKLLSFISEGIWDGSNPNNLISDEDMAKLKAVKPDDNPIIVLFKLKDDI